MSRVRRSWRLLLRDFRYRWRALREGFDRRDLWSIDFALFKWLLPRVKAFRKSECNGCPCSPPIWDDDDQPGSYERWDEILGEVIWFLEYMEREEMWPGRADPDYRRVMRGYGLLIKWLPAMWE